MEEALTYRVAINGFGRIGRGYLRSLFARGLFDEGIVVVGINDLRDDKTLTHLFQFGLVLPELAGKLQGVALRVPVETDP